MKKRGFVVAGLALASLLAGVLWRRGQETGPSAAGTGAAANGMGEAQNLWSMRFDKPGGGTLNMADFKGQPLVLNFWGSWCPPCVAEMPDLDQFAREFAPQGWRVLGLAVDNPRAVSAFLATHPVSYAIGLAGFEGAGLSRELGNEKGGLPYTVVFDRQGRITVKKAGAATLDDMRGWAVTN